MTGGVVVITGGGRGIGAATAVACATAGFDVCLCYRDNSEAAARVADQCVSLGRQALAVRADVGEPSDIEALFAAADGLGPLVGLVNNAGIVAPAARVESLDAERISTLMRVNVVGAFLCAREAVRRMSSGGSIVNVSSTEGFIGAYGLAAYSASKFGVRGLTKAAARELGQYGIRVNSIHPGGVLTPLSLQDDVVAATADSADAFLKALPLGRMGKSKEVSGLVVYLASDDSSYCTGSEVLVDGGMLTGAGY